MRKDMSMTPMCAHVLNRRAADEARAHELAAVVVVQKHSRGFLVRKRMDKFR